MSGDLKRKAPPPSQSYVDHTQVPKSQDVLVYWRTILLAVLKEFYPGLNTDTVTYKYVYENVIGGDTGFEELKRDTSAKLNEFLTRRDSKVSPMILMYLLNVGFNDENPLGATHFDVWEKFMTAMGERTKKSVSIAKDVEEFTTRFSEGKYRTGEFLFQRGTGYLYAPVVKDAFERIRKRFHESEVIARLVGALEKVSFVYEDMPPPPAKRARSQFSDDEEEEGKVSVEEDDEDEE